MRSDYSGRDKVEDSCEYITGQGVRIRRDIHWFSDLRVDSVDGGKCGRSFSVSWLRDSLKMIIIEQVLPDTLTAVKVAVLIKIPPNVERSRPFANRVNTSEAEIGRGEF